MNWEDAEVGKQYKYEEGSFTQGEVTILEKEESPEYVLYKIKVDKSYRGLQEGGILNVGKARKSIGLYLGHKQKFLSLEDKFSYL